MFMYKLSPEASCVCIELEYRCVMRTPFTVVTADLQWVPLGDQASRLGDVGPVHDDIVIAKLRPGQVMDDCVAY